MGYVYSGVDELAKGETPQAGRGECVDIIKEYVPGLKGKSTTTWRAGAWVMEAGASIRRGTAIATFDKDGRFPQHRSGQHAAIVLRVMGSGIWVVDQWRSKKMITKRLIRIPPPHHQRNPDGSFPDASNNALAFRVIE
jgi:copper chaperone CopZ